MFSSGSLPGRQIQPVYGYFKSPLYYITHLEVRTRVKKIKRNQYQLSIAGSRAFSPPAASQLLAVTQGLRKPDKDMLADPYSCFQYMY